MLRGLAHVRYQAADLAAARRWYTELLGIEPYFERPGYVEFRVGDFRQELGLVDAAYVSELGAHGTAEAGGAVVSWHVEDLPATLDRLLAMGAKEHEPARDFGEGFVGASVIDPFGNVLGIMRNPNYLDVLAETGKA